MIGPVLLPAKRVLQNNWQLKILWDEKLPEDLLKDWNKWKENLTLLNHVTFPRCYFPGGCSLDATVQLHHFSDASGGRNYHGQESYRPSTVRVRAKT